MKFRFQTCQFLNNDDNKLHFCAYILTLNNSWISGLDLFHCFTIVPTLFFVLFLISKLRMSAVILKHSNSLVLPTIYTFVWAVCVFHLITSIVTMVIATSSFEQRDHLHTLHNIGGKVCLGLLTFVIEFIELAVVVFMFFHGTSLSNIKVLTRTSFIAGMIALFDNCISVTLSVIFPISNQQPLQRNEQNQLINIPMGENALYNLISTSIFVILYLIILLLPLFKSIKNRVPQRRSFYYYIAFLLFNNGIELIGGALILACSDIGLCFMSLSKFIHFSLYAPVLYVCFLGQYFTRELFDEITVELYSNQLEIID
jgi:hypothetical protein